MIIVCRVGSNAAGESPKFLRAFANSQAAACASADILSAPGTRERTSPRRAHALAAAVHLAAAAAPGPGVARAAACRSAVAAIHAGGGKSGGRAEALPGRGPLPAMMLQSQHCSTSAVTRACMLTKNTDAQEPCTWPELAGREEETEAERESREEVSQCLRDMHGTCGSGSRDAGAQGKNPYVFSEKKGGPFSGPTPGVLL